MMDRLSSTQEEKLNVWSLGSKAQEWEPPERGIKDRMGSRKSENEVLTTYLPRDESEDNPQAHHRREPSSKATYLPRCKPDDNPGISPIRAKLEGDLPSQGKSKNHPNVSPCFMNAPGPT
nr:hypothetical protein Iba_chr10aCG10640 [Ipomoea batatas]